VHFGSFSNNIFGRVTDQELPRPGLVVAELPGSETPILARSARDGPIGAPRLEHADRSRWLVFWIVAIAMFMSTIDLTIVATALPAIHQSLHATINWAGWTITIYGLGVAIASPIAGKTSDQFGRRRVFLSGIVLFTVSSLLCGFATDIYVLIAFRALQALGGGALAPSAAGIVSDHFGKDRDRVLGFFGSVYASGSVVGPLLGGVLVGYLSWRWVFFVNVPIGIVLVCLTIRFIPESRRPSSAKIDIRGLLLTTAFVFSAIFGITNLGAHRASILDPIVLVPSLCAIGFLVLFLRHAGRAPAPFIPMRLLAGKGLGVLNVENFLSGVVSFGVMSLVPLYAEQRYRLHPLDAGTLLTARAFGSFFIGIIAAFTLRRTGYRLPMMVGFILWAVGLLLIGVAPPSGISPYLWLSVIAGITGFGNGAIGPAVRTAGIQFAPDQVAAINGLRQTFANLGITFSVAISTAVLNRAGNVAITQAHIFWFAAGIVMVVMIPLVFRVPEHKGAW
jgi:EmrB/QacA subfamily drug resistance transporter